MAAPSVTRLEGRLEQGRYLDPLGALSRLLGQPEGSILRRFNAERSDIELFPSHLRYVALLAMLLCLSYVSHLAPAGRSLRLRYAGFLLLLTGLLALVTMLLVARFVDGQLDAALSAGALSQAPPGVATLVRDVEGSLRADLNRSMLQPALVLALLGLVALVASSMPLALAQRLRSNVRSVYGTRRGRLALAAVVLIAAGAGAWFVYSAGQPEPRACNGHRELCRRPLNQVTFAATHNSMAAAADGWLFPDQEYGIRAQLDAGVHGLLIDTHYWEKDANDLQVATGQPIPGGLGGSIANLLGSLGTPIPGPLLCHTLCVLGNQPLAEGLSEIKSWMDQNRNEVLIIVVEDYISPVDTAKAFHESGLDRYSSTTSPAPAGPLWVR